VNEAQRTALTRALWLAAEGYASCSRCTLDGPCDMHADEHSIITDAWAALNSSQHDLRVFWEQAKRSGDGLAWTIYGEWTPNCSEYKAAEEWEQLTGKHGGARLRWSPGDGCDCVTQHVHSCPAILSWHQGPTPWDSGPGKLWCYRCGGEVVSIGDQVTCSGCDDGIFF
jgi:hypothetical protein